MNLVGRQYVKGLCELGLPRHLVLAIDLGADLEVVTRLRQQNRTDDNLIGSSYRLVVIDVRCAVWAIVAVDVLACSWSVLAVANLTCQIIPESPLYV